MMHNSSTEFQNTNGGTARIVTPREWERTQETSHPSVDAKGRNGQSDAPPKPWRDFAIAGVPTAPASLWAGEGDYITAPVLSRRTGARTKAARLPRSLEISILKVSADLIGEHGFVGRSTRGDCYLRGV
jgi:hypothetical protein